MGGIRSIFIHDINTPCDTSAGYKEEKLFRWPGSVQGYRSNDGKYHEGTSSDAVFTNRPKRAFFANIWRSARFCLSRQDAATMKRLGGRAGSCNSDTEF